jgi:hypothetical protein
VPTGKHIGKPTICPEGEMDAFSIWHWLVVVLFVILYGIPMARIIRRTGHSRFWVIAFFLPLVNLVALWVFTFARWPATDQS